MRLAMLIGLMTATLAAQIIPGRYVVELSSEPLGKLPESRRAALESEQRSFQASVEKRGGKVLGRTKNVINAVSVSLPSKDVAGLRAMPGVKRVFPVTQQRLALDRALPLHQVPQAWAQIGGMGKAGLGMKIGILDSGITPGHLAFQDSSLTPPQGYPIISGPENKSVVNNKIIVARDYASYYMASKPDSAIDVFGHGTQTAACAAGMPAMGPFTTVVGVAPKAFLGIYKITSLDQDTVTSDVIVAALDDAYGDGMDVVNLSFASSVEYYSSLEDYVLDRLAELGMLVAISAGNGGPFPDTVGDGADDGSVIAVGASQSDREFTGSVAGPGIVTPIVGTSGSYTAPNPPVTAPLADLAVVDPTNLGCGASLPANSLTGTIAITTGTPNCLFQTVLNNAQSAGAVGVIFYSPTKNGIRTSTYLPQATLPSIYVSNVDGLTLKGLAATKTVVTTTFEGIATPNDARSMASFSSRGPTDVSGLKPDLIATGTFVYMPTQTANPAGQLYNSTGFLQENGTSFSSPIVAGAAALLKGARPGLTADQYRSLLINSADPLILPSGLPEMLQNSGTGILNANSALSSSVAAYPTSLSFQTGGSAIDAYDLLSITNVGSQPETFTVKAIPYDAATPPTFSTDGSNVYLGSPGSPNLSVTLAPKQSKIVYVDWAAQQLASGQYQGQIAIHGNVTGSTALVPYWYANPSGVPAYLSALPVPSQASPGTEVGIYFKVLDSTGTAILDPSTLSVTSSATGGGKIQGPFPSSDYVNWLYMIATLSATPGTNTFTLNIGGFSPVTFNVQGVSSAAPGAIDVTTFIDAPAIWLRAKLNP